MAVSVTFVGAGDAFGSGGRFNTCIMVDGADLRFTIDFGASSLVALNKLGIDHNSIDAVLLTHMHGDHFGGLPFMLLDAMLGARRNRPLTIAGPKNLEARVVAAVEALFPGSGVMKPKFPLHFIELEVGAVNNILGLEVTPYPARHTPQADPTALRVAVDDKVVTYSGDGEYTEALTQASRDADLFIAECYFHDRPVQGHMNYTDIAAHRDDFAARRLILTHLGPEMLAKSTELPEECAEDGLVVRL
ncbi:MAG: MBL fold metallo-hydrolase [Rhodospirillaceae bacterium]|jgi:ribonuclease BN (tRNA processing enzyme)|nr:MBL fold metallo-hydrolase [Rhodospirillaceae bacterium]MBT4691110.1 MBL fold metallo-hydrolase [Rhodospirillaceae bacterium]MBT5084051.1 MBL fold metallo-hydrolase [Rhodospirillaceae bacterium]MBT5525100.1 MBL fold metallo-hydrolase [Rhodospirillaceae bacterium]MBT5882136.1 MBL fold metallo-hydrolase [Rhodospirillaceae bacterium]